MSECAKCLLTATSTIKLTHPIRLARFIRFARPLGAASFVSSKATKNAFLASGLLGYGRTTSHFEIIDHDLGSAMIVSTDYDGVIRVYLRKNAFDAIIKGFGKDDEARRSSATTSDFPEFSNEPFGLSTL